MKVVIDTNVWVSALVFGGKPRQIFKNAANSGIEIVISAEILSEIRRILNQKFPDFMVDFEELLIALTPRLYYVELGSMQVDVCRDPKDNMILETAITGGADYIISGDNDLLVLKKLQTTKIISPAEFLKT